MNAQGPLRLSNFIYSDVIVRSALSMKNIPISPFLAADDEDVREILEKVTTGRLLMSLQRAFTEYTKSLTGTDKLSWSKDFQEALAEAGMVYDNSAHADVVRLIDCVRDFMAGGSKDDALIPFYRSLWDVLTVRYPYAAQNGYMSELDYTNPARWYEYEITLP